ncbi:MAG: sugar transferase [Chloroflexota bacterium]
MTILQFASQSAEEWIGRLGPQKRVLTGNSYLVSKRIMDISLVLLSLPFWLPVLAVIAFVIRITSPGAPVVFKQLRTGKGGRRFHIY